jgi:hypothetical protein
VTGLVRGARHHSKLEIDGSATLMTVALLVIMVIAFSVWSFGPFENKSKSPSFDAIPQDKPTDAWTFVGRSPPHTETVLSACEPGRSDVVLPSGVWRGYSQERGQDFDMVEWDFQFSPGGAENQPGQVMGSGTDDIGKYSLAGVFEQRRLAFQKKYIWGTPALNGRVNHELNTGHVVEYRAEWAGENLRKGIRGIWYTEEVTGSPRGTGRFHVWPAMEGWQRIGSAQRTGGSTSQAPSIADKSRAKPGDDTPRYAGLIQVNKDHLCAMCYENPINVCLQPCGHTAICKSCETKLRHRLCPICYAPVTMIITEHGIVKKPRLSSIPSNSPAVVPRSP